MITRWRVFIFIIFLSCIWHPWLMTKWHGHPIGITMIKKWLQVIWYEHRQPYPSPTYILTYLPTHPSINLPIYLTTKLPTYIFTYPPTHISSHTHATYVPTHAPTYLPRQPTYLLAYVLSPISYNHMYYLLPIILQLATYFIIL